MVVELMPAVAILNAQPAAIIVMADTKISIAKIIAMFIVGSIVAAMPKVLAINCEVITAAIVLLNKG